MDELIVLVNENNEEIGTAKKLAGHNADTPLHRAFSCYVFNQEGKFLVTQRAKSKKVFPGVWTNSCCGHPGPGERTEDAIRRRLKFELGLASDTIKVVIPYFKYRATFKGIVENEISPVYIARVIAEPQVNPKEVEDYKWITWDKFVQVAGERPKVYSYWCRKQVEALQEMKNFPKSFLS